MALTPPALVASDLDGTLLDHDSYDFAPARPALDALARAGVPLVLCSSKTQAEMEPLALALAVPGPLVVENGGAVVWPGPRQGAAALRARCERQVLGVPRARLLAALPGVARAAGVRVRAFAEMSLEEVVALTGLPRAQAELALRREFDEPFVVLDTPAGRGELTARLDRVAREAGLRVTRGGRLFHLSGDADKGLALRAILERLPHARQGTLLGLGDAPNDLPLLRAVTRPVLMPGRGGLVDPELAAALPQAERAPEPGPAGWGAAVLAVLAGGALPRVAA